MKKSIVTIFLLAGLVLCTLGRPETTRAQNTVDYDLMRRDLGIMESILRTITSSKEIRDHYNSLNIRSSYIEGYGAVFQMTYAPRNYRGTRAAAARRQFDNVRERLMGVFADYANQIKQVKSNETIKIMVYPNAAGSVRNVGSVPRNSRSAEDSFEPPPYILSARKSDLARLDKNDRTGLSRTVRYTPYVNGDDIYGSSATKEDIAIMQSILERSFEDHFRIGFSSNFARGGYLDDYGVLINLSVSGSIYSSGLRVSLITSGTLLIDSLIAGGKRIAISIDNPDRFIDRNLAILARQERMKSAVERKSEFIDRLVEILGTYGGTIKELDPDKRITVYMTTRGQNRNLPIDLNLVYTVRFGDILEYEKGRISLSDLRSRSKIIEF